MQAVDSLLKSNTIEEKQNFKLTLQLQHQISAASDLSHIKQKIEQALNCGDKNADFEILLKSILFEIERLSSQSFLQCKLLAEFNQLYEDVLSDRVSSKQISEWYQRTGKNRIATQLSHYLQSLFNMRIDLQTRDTQISVLNDRVEKIEEILSQIDTQIQELEQFAFGQRYQMESASEKFPHLFKLSNFIFENTLSKTQSEVIDEIVAKSQWILGNNTFEQYEIQQFCQSIETLTKRFMNSSNLLFQKVCMLLKSQMHLIQSLNKNKKEFEIGLKEKVKEKKLLLKKSHDREIESLNRQVTDQLLQMQQQTAKLVQHLSRNHDDSCCQDVSRETMRELKAQIERLTVENRENLKSIKNFENRILQYKETELGFKKIVNTLENQIVELKSNIDNNEFGDASDQNIKPIEENGNTIKCINRKLSLQIKQLQEQVQINKTINASLTQNQKNIEKKLSQNQKCHQNLIKKNRLLQDKLKQINNRQQKNVLFDIFDFKTKEKALQDKIVKLTLTLETVKSQYLEQLRSKSAAAQKQSEINKQSGNLIDDRVQLFIQKRTLQDQNKNLLQSLDKLNFMVNQLEKRNRKLVRQCTNKSKLVQKQNYKAQYLQKKINLPTDGQDEILKRADPNFYQNQQQLAAQNQQLKNALKVAYEEKSFYLKALRDQVINGKVKQYQYQAQLPRCKTQQLPKNHILLPTKIDISKVSSRSSNFDPSTSDPELKSQQINDFLCKLQAISSDFVINTEQNAIGEENLFGFKPNSRSERINLFSYIQTSILNLMKAKDEFPNVDIGQIEQAVSDFSKTIVNFNIEEAIENFQILLQKIFKTIYKSSKPQQEQEKTGSEQLRLTVIQAIGWGKLRHLINDFIQQRKPEVLKQIESLILR